MRNPGYNLPDWGDTPEELYACMDSLFTVTPPHVLLIDGTPFFHGIRDHLLKRGIEAPRDISLVSIGNDHAFSFYRPAVSHFDWELDAMPRRVVNWLKSVERGKPTRRHSPVKARFVEGGTIGPAPGRPAR